MHLLVLTDHRRHSDANSLYALARAFVADSRLSEVRVASRGTPANAAFFAAGPEPDPNRLPLATLTATRDFSRVAAAAAFEGADLSSTPLAWADVVFLRVPHPVPASWFTHLRRCFGDKPIYNRPEGIAETTDKAWLRNVAELCPPMRVCRSAQRLVTYIASPAPDGRPRDLVLKPLRGYGGQGVMRAYGGAIYTPDGPVPLADWPAHPLARESYLAMDFLPGVREGDKRIVVVDGHIVGAALRVPAPGQWLCNISQGGHAELTEPDPAELAIVRILNPLMDERGIVMYGVDTLLGNEGHRVLSEVNTMSIGGLLDLPDIFGRTAVQYAAELLASVFVARRRTR